MIQFENFVKSLNQHVCKLGKTLYGLKQALRAWFAKLSSTRFQFGFKNTKSNISLFTRITSSSTIYILVYVDDIFVIGNNPIEISLLSTQDPSEMNYFLGIEVNKLLLGAIQLIHSKYIKDLS